MQENVTGMVLKSSPIGEYDKRIVLLTKEYGKISAFAKGARKQDSPLLACSQPFTFGKFSVFRGRSSFHINHVSVKNYFTELRSDLDSVYYAYYFCEIADYYSAENIDGFEILVLLYQSLRALGSPSLNNRLIRYIVELKMLAINGETPRVYQCINCGSKENLRYFAIESQGVFCESCGKASHHILMSGAAIFTLQKIIHTDCKSLFTFTVSDQVLEELQIVIGSYWADRVDKVFQSIEILEETARETL